MITMNPITISQKSLPKDDIVLLPRRDYEQLIKLAHFQTELDEDLKQSLKDIKNGNIFGPFNTVEELKKSIEL